MTEAYLWGGFFLLMLILITFGLMWALLGVFEDQAKVDKASNNPMAESEKERLPAEPRLQAAPGFGVDSPNGWVNMELVAPQAADLLDRPAAKPGRRQRIMVAGHPGPVGSGDQRRESVEIGRRQAALGAAVVKTVAEGDHPLRPEAADDGGEHP